MMSAADVVDGTMCTVPISARQRTIVVLMPQSTATIVRSAAPAARAARAATDVSRQVTSDTRSSPSVLAASIAAAFNVI